MAVTELLGALIAFCCFRRKERAVPARLPKTLLAALGGLLAVAVIAAAAIAAIWSAWVYQIIPPESVGRSTQFILQASGLIFFLAAAAGLFQARLSNRRWRSLYLLGLALLLVCAALMAMLTSMDMEAGSHSMVRVLSQIGGMGLVGLAVAGVSLC